MGREAGLRAIADKRNNMFLFAPHKIKVEEGLNPRGFHTPEMRERMDRLKESIKAVGVIEPLWIRYDAAYPETPILVDGETRLRVCLELIKEGHNIELLPCVAVAANNEIQRSLAALTANTGHPFTQLEAGTIFQRLVNFGVQPEQIAIQTGYSKRYVTDALALFDAPQRVKEMVERNEVSTGAAVSTLKKHGSKAATILKEKVDKAKRENPVAATGKAKAKPVLVKREKAIAENHFKRIVLEIAKDVRPEIDKMNKSDEDYEFVSVKTKLILKLLAVAETA